MRYDDIDPSQRIGYASTMTGKAGLQFTGTVTLRFAAAAGCLLIPTEQGAYLDGRDTPQDHRAGWEAMFDLLVDYLARAAG